MIPYILDNTKTLQELAADNTNGLGSLPECIEATVHQERNGEFTLRIRIPMSAKRFPEIQIGGILKAKVDQDSPLQMFRISKISRPISGIVTIDANHISYDLGKTSVLPFSTAGASNTMAQLKAKMLGGSAFILSTDINNPTSAFTNTKPQSLRALLGGQQGSVLDVFGGEFIFDNLQVILKANRGRSAGIELRYGKNITDLKQDENIENTYTAVMPYAVDSTGNAITGALQIAVETAEPKILNLDLSSSFQTTTDPEAITPERLNELAAAYIQNNNIGVPKVSITVSFINLADTVEYKDIAPLERVSLCDTVTVNYEKLGISATAKVVSYDFNVLTERYNSITIGEAKSSLAKTISGIALDSAGDAVQSATGYMDNTVSAFTDLIANGLGLFVTKEAVGETGGVKIYLHNKPTRAESQYQWTINSSGLAVSQDYGETWAAGIDGEGNAIFNSIAANQVNAMDIVGANITGTNISGSKILFQAEDLEGNDASILAEGGVYTVGDVVKAGVFFRNKDLGGGDTVGNFIVKAEDFGVFAGADVFLHSDDSLALRKYNGSGQMVGAVGIDAGGTAYIRIFDDSGNQLATMYATADGTIFLGQSSTNTSISISPSTGIGIFINGSGHTGLHFVNDGNGHAVLGV